MLDVHQAFELGTFLCQKLHDPVGSDDWRESPWGWIRDLRPDDMGRLTADLVGFLLSSQGIANIPTTPAGRRATVQVGRLLVDCYATTRESGDTFAWRVQPPSASASHVLLLGLAPMECWALLDTAKGLRELAAPSWTVRVSEECCELLPIDQAVEALRDTARDSLRRSVRAATGSQ